MLACSRRLRGRAPSLEPRRRSPCRALARPHDPCASERSLPADLPALLTSSANPTRRVRAPACLRALDVDRFEAGAARRHLFALGHGCSAASLAARKKLTRGMAGVALGRVAARDRRLPGRARRPRELTEPTELSRSTRARGPCFVSWAGGRRTAKPPTAEGEANGKKKPA